MDNNKPKYPVTSIHNTPDWIFRIVIAICFFFLSIFSSYMHHTYLAALFFIIFSLIAYFIEKDFIKITVFEDRVVIARWLGSKKYSYKKSDIVKWKQMRKKSFSRDYLEFTCYTATGNFYFCDDYTNYEELKQALLSKKNNPPAFTNGL
jgi:hypothetical protein